MKREYEIKIKYLISSMKSDMYKRQTNFRKREDFIFLLLQS